MSPAREESGLRGDVTVQTMCAKTGALHKTKQFRSNELIATIDDDGARGFSVRTRPAPTVIAEGVMLRGASIGSQFARDGKATIKLPAAHLYIFISNADPISLREWLEKLGPFLGIASTSRTLATATAARTNARARDEDSACNAKRIKSSTASDPALSAEQQAVVASALSGRSLFFTGAAGTGKSVVLRALVGCLPPESTAVTAMTASAAAHIGGMTLHAFAGIGNGERPLAQLVASAERKRRDAWRRAAVLIVDEVSMLSAELFDKLEYVARAVRGNEAPFGGLQLILCGDFFQLPPVSRSGLPPARFAFQAAGWARCKLAEVELQQVHRQAEPILVEMLNDMRVGRLSSRALATIASCERPLEDLAAAPGVRATKLFTHRADCDSVNEAELSKLPLPAVVVRAFDSGEGVRGASAAELLASCAAKAQLELRVGAQVLLLRSISLAEGLTNGARGVVVRFEQSLPVVLFACGIERRIERQPFLVVQDGRCVAVRSQLPLALGWAISIHRSQGLSLELLEVSLDRAFEYGQAYVALSRCKSLGGLHVRAFDPSAVRAHPDVIDFHAGIALRAQEDATRALHAAAERVAGVHEGVQVVTKTSPMMRAKASVDEDSSDIKRMQMRLAQLRRERHEHEGQTA